MHRPPTALLSGPRLVPVLWLIGVVGLGACAKRPSPPVQALEWQGLLIGMERNQAEKRLRDAGLRFQCAPAKNVTFLDGQALYTRWVKQAQAGRVVLCTASRKKGAKPGPDGVLQSKLYFLDDKLYRLHVKILSTDRKFGQLLRARYGTPRQQTIARYAYAGKQPSRIRMWTLKRPSTQLLWLRSGHHQQLVLFTRDPERVKALRALSSSRKGD
jgi:hypothetical protein